MDGVLFLIINNKTPEHHDVSGSKYINKETSILVVIVETR